jgi:Transposase
MAYCGGLDWGSAEHGVCIIEHDSGKIAAQFPVPHDAAGIADLMRRLARLAPPGDLPIAIERPSGLIVDALVAAGHPVVPIHPNVVKASRELTATRLTELDLPLDWTDQRRLLAN